MHNKLSLDKNRFVYEYFTSFSPNHNQFLFKQKTADNQMKASDKNNDTGKDTIVHKYKT